MGYSLRQGQRQHGFTLVELIVVLVILAILAALLIPALRGYIDNAKDKRLIAICRSCVTAAQTLSTEAYAQDGQVIGPNYPTDANIRRLAEVDQGQIMGLLIGGTGTGTDKNKKLDPAAVRRLTYVDEDGRYVTYCREPGSKPVYIISDHAEEWALGITFAVDDVMTSNGYVFRCIRAHTSGTTSRTRNPSLRSNKSTWEVIGYAGEPKKYSSTVRYTFGVDVVYKENLYRRKDFNLVGGQVPYEGKDSDYWIYIGPAE